MPTTASPPGDTYDNNGNTISSGGVANVYDFENHLIQKDGVSIKYDGDGNRIFKTVAGVTTGYLLDDRSPTGYVQVLDEVQGPSITRSYVYGLELIEQDRVNTSTLRQSTSYNVYDGHGSVRALTDLNRCRHRHLRLRRLRQHSPQHRHHSQQLPLLRRAVRSRSAPLLQPRPLSQRKYRSLLVHRL